MPVVTKPWTFSNTPPNTNVVDADKFNDNFDVLYNLFDENITNAHIDANAGIAYSKLNLAGSIKHSDFEASVLPSGLILPFGGAAAPSGWLLCDGGAISRATYATLFAVIGTSFGVGDGSTTFNVPDLRGRTPVGKGSHTSVDALGESEGASEANRTPKHYHATDAQGGHSHTVAVYQSGGVWDGSPSGGMRSGGSTATSSVGNHSHTAGTNDGRPQDTPAFQVVNYIVRT